MRELGPSGAQLVVVGVDGSPGSVEAARYAADEAAARGADLMVVHACAYGVTPGKHDLAADDTRRDTGQRLVDETLAHVPIAATTVVRTVVEVAPTGALLTAVAGDAALLVLGQHRFDLADGRVAGRVAPLVAASARCPVVVVPAGWARTDARSAHLGQRPVVVGLSGRRPATSVLRLAWDEAELRHTSVLILHAMTGADPAVSQRATSARTMAEIVAGQHQDHPDVAIDYRFVPGVTVGAWVDASSRASLMVLGRTRGLRGRRAWQHSVARTLLHQARCPLVVVPPRERPDAGADRPGVGTHVLALTQPTVQPS